jgi:hypothetical protein
MTTPRQRIAELTRIEEEREERCAWYILRRLSGEIPGQERWARNTVAELIAAAGSIDGCKLEEQLATWDRFQAGDYAASDDPELESLLFRLALEGAIGRTGWEEPSPVSPHADAVAECIAYRVGFTTYGPGLFEAGFQLSDLRPLLKRVLKEGIDPEIVRVAEETQPFYSDRPFRRYPAAVRFTVELRRQIVDALAARGFASELFESGGAWHIRSV